MSSVKNADRLHDDDSPRQTARTEQSAATVNATSVDRPADTASEATMRCPACRAQQNWSPDCRRCGADLMMLRQFESTCRHQRRLSLTALRDGRNQVATCHASRLFQLRPDADSARLLAVCLLISGNFVQACRIASLHES